MANEIRLRLNNLSGTISDNPLASGSTTINSPLFTDLPVVDGTNHLILILDPLELTGPAEIVRVTAHTSLATSVTVSRGQEGSSARSHSFGSTWFHGPVASDWTNIYTSSTRPTPAYEGQFIYETDTNKLVGFGGVDWAPRDAGGQLGYVQATGGDQVITAGALLTSLSIAVTVGTGRRVKVSTHGQVFSSVLDDCAEFQIRQDGVSAQQFNVNRLNGAAAQSFAYSFVLSPSAGSHTYTVFGSRIVGTGAVSHRATAAQPAFILVEDIGAA